MISAKSFWETLLFGGKLQKDFKNSNFNIFESALYMKSGMGGGGEEGAK